jgi:microcystin-dependent protein
MGTKYSTVSISSYNASPPADDGTQDASNQLNWDKHKVKIGDPLKTAIESINANLVTALNQDVLAKTDSYNIVAADHDKTVVVTTTSAGANISLPDATGVGSGFIVTIVNAADSTDALTIDLVTATDFLNGTSNGTISLPVDSALSFITNSGTNGFNIRSAANVSVAGTTSRAAWPAGLVTPYAGSTAPDGWLDCDGAAVSRTTYSALFTAISTTWGEGDGSTTFNLPNFNGRVLIGDGTGLTSEDVTAGAVDVSAGTSSAGAFTVNSNADKWITGMPVTLTSGSSLPNGVSSGTTYYVIRESSVAITLASSLANAQNGVPLELGTQGVGTHTIIYTHSARTLGGIGGEETHAMSSTELLAHSGHSTTTQQASAAAGFAADKSATSTGGNAAMNNMQPYGIVKYIISY